MIPVNNPLFEAREKQLLSDCLDTGWISSDGPYVAQFENAFAGYIGVKHGIAVCNGTVALELAMAALELPPGSEVIVPTFTIISCVLAVLRNGLKPVLVDADRDTWTMDVEQVQRRIGPRTKAIMPVHIYGHPVEMAPIRELAGKHGLMVVEDAAEAHGALCLGKMCGSLSDIGAFSFYANKIITTGEGGMCVTDRDDLGEKLRSLRNLCFIPERRFEHRRLGYNFRMTNLQAAIGLAQVERADELIRRKHWQGDEYGKRLSGVNGIHLQAVKPWADPVHWVHGIVLEQEVPMDALELSDRLSRRGVQTRPFFFPMHEQPVFRDMGLFKGESYPVSERISRRGLYLPSGMGLDEAQIDSVCRALKKCLIKA